MIKEVLEKLTCAGELIGEWAFADLADQLNEAARIGAAPRSGQQWTYREVRQALKKRDLAAKLGRGGPEFDGVFAALRAAQKALWARAESDGDAAWEDYDAEVEAALAALGAAR